MSQSKINLNLVPVTSTFWTLLHFTMFTSMRKCLLWDANIYIYSLPGKGWLHFDFSIISVHFICSCFCYLNGIVLCHPNYGTESTKVASDMTGANMFKYNMGFAYGWHLLQVNLKPFWRFRVSAQTIGYVFNSKQMFVLQYLYVFKSIVSNYFNLMAR